MQHLVLVRRAGERWRADIYRQLAGSRERLLDVTGDYACVAKVAQEAPALLAAGDLGAVYLLLEALGCRRRPRLATGKPHGLLASKQPADTDTERRR
jgi:hypothetical protein